MSHTIRPLFLFFLLVLVVHEARGCSCSANTSNVKQQVRWHNLIFSGKLVSVKVRTDGKFDKYIYKFIPATIWRGANIDTITIEQEVNPICNSKLATGNTYIIYARLNQELSDCSRRINSDIDTETQNLNKLFTRKLFKQLQAAG